ncbi:hypothetical protein [Streptomyces sp. NPDC101150]|uniref:hypothetical protein n=1 Tax=Streptomyces sp. NPDC101150 TaxID=3366114 RepID=UPI00382ADFAA
MSDLATVSAEIAPYLALAANSLGTSVITAAQQRIAERTVTAGEGFFRRLLHRGDADGLGDSGSEPLLDTRRADALDELLAGLDDRERRLLSAAVTAWLENPADRRDADGLLAHISRLAPAHGSTTVINTATTHGAHSVAANTIGTLNFGATGTQDGS